jgi:hypothetical protein
VFASTVRRSTIVVWFCSDGGHGKEAGSRIVDFENDNVVKPISFILLLAFFSGGLRPHKHELKEK